MNDDFDTRLKAQLQALADAVPTATAAAPAARPAVSGRLGHGRPRTRTALPIGSLAAVALIVLTGFVLVPRLGLGGPGASPTPVGGSFVATGSMTTARAGATATELEDGRVLIAGGHNQSGDLSSAELYDQATGRFSPTGSMTGPRAGQSATLLQDGRVLIVGGSIKDLGSGSAELYDPSKGTFVATGSMTVDRSNCSATLLADGRVLVAGGLGVGGQLASAELYEPATGTFSATGSMVHPRAFHSATLLSDGRVLIASGDRAFPDSETAELYDPAAGRFQVTGSMARVEFAPTLLQDGRVLFVAGSDEVGLAGSHAEMYDPASGTFTETGSMTIGREGASATRLADGRVLVAGGILQDLTPPKTDMVTKVLASAEVFDPTTGKFSPTASMSAPRADSMAVLLSDGMVLVAGGNGSAFGNDAALASAELYVLSNIEVAPTAVVAGSTIISPRVVLSFGTDVLTAAVLGPDGAAYVLDSTTETVYRVDLATGAKLPVVTAGQGAAGANVGSPRLLTTGGADVLILDDANSLWRWHPAAGTTGRGALIKVNIPDSADWGAGVRAMGTFVTDAALNLYDIYVVVPSRRQVLKYAPAVDGSGYPAPTTYLAVAKDLSAVDDMYVDGAVYIVGGGKVSQYSLGTAVPGWSLANPAAPPSAGQFYARLTADDPNQDKGNLYAYDRSNRAVFAFAKRDGAYVAQYSISSDAQWFSALAGMFVVPGAGATPATLFWVESGSLMSAALDGSAAPTPAAPTPSATAVTASSGSAPASSPTAASSPQPNPTYLEYETLPSDTLPAIAARFGLQVWELELANPQIKATDTLKVGTVINIPPTGLLTPPPSPGPS